ncbi:hypothetical protein [Nocardioides gilvus]|uniref:hypothetical protein n=1 Tax=Nocardioides gilvus TaxID=1735589 RepID=UPI0013A5B89A|nr:hypothetical protein [Nocardioides gilvus]
MTLLSVVVGVLVLTYVAFPHRGEDVPGAPWLGQAMRRGIERLPARETDEEPLLRRR